MKNLDEPMKDSLWPFGVAATYTLLILALWAVVLAIFIILL